MALFVDLDAEDIEPPQHLGGTQPPAVHPHPANAFPGSAVAVSGPKKDGNGKEPGSEPEAAPRPPRVDNAMTAAFGCYP